MEAALKYLVVPLTFAHDCIYFNLRWYDVINTELAWCDLTWGGQTGLDLILGVPWYWLVWWPWLVSLVLDALERCWWHRWCYRKRIEKISSGKKNVSRLKSFYCLWTTRYVKKPPSPMTVKTTDQMFGTTNSPNPRASDNAPARRSWPTCFSSGDPSQRVFWGPQSDCAHRARHHQQLRPVASRSGHPLVPAASRRETSRLRALHLQPLRRRAGQRQRSRTARYVGTVLGKRKWYHQVFQGSFRLKR